MPHPRRSRQAGLGVRIEPGAIPENTPEKEARAAAMNAEEKAGHLPETYAEHRRWIGDLPPHGS
jgi:hypothetical protein